MNVSLTEGRWMFGIGPQETFVILIVILLLFGANRIPEVARSIGKGMHEFRKAANEFQRAIEEEPALRRPREGASDAPAPTPVQAPGAQPRAASLPAPHADSAPPPATTPGAAPPAPAAGLEAGGPSSAVPPAGSA